MFPPSLKLIRPCVAQL